MTDYLFDTNVLLRASDPASPAHMATARAVATLLSQGHQLSVTAQNLIEFWAVATRPVSANGLGWSVEDTEKEVQRLMQRYPLLPDTEDVLPQWQGLVSGKRVIGRQIHDARLVAVMLTHGVTHLLTFNVADFAPYSEITPVDPRSIISSGVVTRPGRGCVPCIGPCVLPRTCYVATGPTYGGATKQVYDRGGEPS